MNFYSTRFNLKRSYRKFSAIYFTLRRGFVISAKMLRPEFFFCMEDRHADLFDCEEENFKEELKKEGAVRGEKVTQAAKVTNLVP